MLEKRKKHWSAHCAASLGSSVSHEKVTTSPLGKERLGREQQGDAVTLKPTSAQNSLCDGACTPSDKAIAMAV